MYMRIYIFSPATTVHQLSVDSLRSTWCRPSLHRFWFSRRIHWRVCWACTFWVFKKALRRYSDCTLQLSFLRRLVSTDRSLCCWWAHCSCSSRMVGDMWIAFSKMKILLKVKLKLKWELNHVIQSSQQFSVNSQGQFLIRITPPVLIIAKEIADLEDVPENQSICNTISNLFLL